MDDIQFRLHHKVDFGTVWVHVLHVPGFLSYPNAWLLQCKHGSCLGEWSHHSLAMIIPFNLSIFICIYL